ncbi:MAG: sugar phosphate isomerase/epimerase family protein [Pseudolabrys sp.]|jgi:deoxyribonuclease-4
MPSFNYGAHTFGFAWTLAADETFSALGNAGFKTVQLMATPPHFDPWKEDHGRTRRLRAFIEQYGMAVIALDLASSDINLASPADDVVDFAVLSYERAIERGAELGARAICVGSGRRHPLLPNVNLRLMNGYRRAFARIRDTALRHGQQVLLENHPLGLLADAGAIESFLASEGDDNTAVIYDVANAFAAGEDPVDGLAALARRIDVVHLSDAPTGQWRHDPIGSGDIDFAAITAALRRANFAGDVVLEILSDNPLEDLTKGIAIVEAAATKAAAL